MSTSSLCLVPAWWTVDGVDDDIRQMVQDLLTTMYESTGIGLAAEQIGRTESVCVVDITGPGPLNGEPPPQDPPMPLVLINPRITEAEGDVRDQEGCLSFPEIFVHISRAEHITVEYTDLQGQDRVLKADDLLARVIQHEVDHLNGVLLVDRMSAVQKVGVAGKLKRLKKAASDQA